jgi:N-acetylglucosamine-6-sulfatase
MIRTSPNRSGDSSLHYSKRILLTGIALLALIVTSTLAAVAQSPEPASELDERPDIFLVMVDDLGYIDDGRVVARLPEVKQHVVDAGLRFTQMYDETPLCCPGRASILTGRHTLHHGVIKNDGDLLDPKTTIGANLQDAGYHTLMVGKYLNQYDGIRMPPGWTHVGMMGDSNPTKFWVDGETTFFGDQFKQDVVRELSVDWVEAAPLDQPVFGWFSSSAPHKCRDRANPDEDCRHPLVMEQDKDSELCTGITDFKPPSYTTEKPDLKAPGKMPDWPNGWQLTKICESMLVVDRMVGELVDVQAERGRPLYIAFVSDNGMSWGQKGFPGKQVPTATHLPFYLAGPGIRAGETAALVSNIDIAPTLAEFAGETVAGADGQSLSPLFEVEVAGREEMLEIMPSGPEQWAAIRTPEWRYIRWDNGTLELFDIQNDPWELDNVRAGNRDVADRFDRRLNRLLKASEG